MSSEPLAAFGRRREIWAMVVSRLLTMLFPAACFGCGLTGPPLCARCAEMTARPRSSWIGDLRVTAAGPYAGTLRRAVLAYKRGRRDVGDTLAALVVSAVRTHVRSDAILVPVPTLARRQRARGFDQSARLARACGVALDLPVLGALVQAAPDAQRGRDRAARIRACGRFACIAPTTLADARVVLVDDVVTTGATLRDCAQTLRGCGARVDAAWVIACA